MFHKFTIFRGPKRYPWQHLTFKRPHRVNFTNIFCSAYLHLYNTFCLIVQMAHFFGIWLNMLILTLSNREVCVLKKIVSKMLMKLSQGLPRLLLGVNFINPFVKSSNLWAHRVWHNQFHQLKFTQLYQYTQLEVTPNFNEVRSATYASKFNVNLLCKSCL